MRPCILFLTCTNRKEADKITQTLLKKHLVVCVKKIPISSSFWWEGKIDHTQEILLMMESEESKFSEAEKEVRKIHSYKTFVLVSLPISKTSKGVKDWLEKELKK